MLQVFYKKPLYKQPSIKEKQKGQGQISLSPNLSGSSKAEKCFKPISLFVYIANYQSKYAKDNRK